MCFHLFPCAQDSKVEAGERFDLGRTMLSSADLLSTQSWASGVLADFAFRSERIVEEQLKVRFPKMNARWPVWTR
jgi:hypothetical protein